MISTLVQPKDLLWSMAPRQSQVEEAMACCRRPGRRASSRYLWGASLMFVHMFLLFIFIHIHIDIYIYIYITYHVVYMYIFIWMIYLKNKVFLRDREEMLNFTSESLIQLKGWDMTPTWIHHDPTYQLFKPSLLHPRTGS